jgi:hypothetical protein
VAVGRRSYAHVELAPCNITQLMTVAAAAVPHVTTRISVNYREQN